MEILFWELEVPASVFSFFRTLPSGNSRGFLMGRLTVHPVCLSSYFLYSDWQVFNDRSLCVGHHTRHVGKQR